MEANMQVLEGAQYRLRVKLTNEAGEQLPPELFRVYAGAFCPGYAPVHFHAERTAEEWVLTMPGLKPGRVPWNWQVIAAEYATGVEWLLAAGEVTVTPRHATGAGWIDPGELMVTATLDKTTLQMTVQLGESTAACGLAVVDARNSAKAADASAKAADTSAKAAANSAEHAAEQAQAAEMARTQADGSATDAANSASAAAGEVTKAAAEVEKAKQERERATVHAKAAAVHAQDAAQAQVTATCAKTDAEIAKVQAQTAEGNAKGYANAAAADKAAAETAKTQAQTAEGNAKASADAAAADKTAAENAKTDALAAQSKAEQAAQQSADNANLLGDAALQSGDNIFTGLNTFSGEVAFSNGVPWVAATAMAFGVPPLAAYATTMAEYIPLSNLDAVTSGQSYSVFAPFIPKILYADRGEYFNNPRFSGESFLVVANVQNVTHPKHIRAVTFSDTETAVENPYRCEDLQLLHVGKSCSYLIAWNHNAFGKAPQLNIYAPNLQRVTTGVLIRSLNSVGTARIKLPSFNSNFTLKIGAIQKGDVLYLLQNLPALKTGVSRTAAISCDPALETDEDFLAQVAAGYDAETKTGWNVALTFQGNAIDAAATTYSMRRITPPIFAMHEECEGGAYVDSDGKRWAVFSGSWVVDENCGYTEFPTIEAALDEWGLTEYQPEEIDN